MTHSHTGWFHRSGTNGEVLWATASTETGHAATSADALEPGGQLVAGSTHLLPVAPVPPGPYPVAEVKGRRPAGLDDFLGVTSFVVMKGDVNYRVFGTGHPGNGIVRFHQQDLRRDGRDVGTWIITTTPHGIIAEPDDDPPGPDRLIVTALAEMEGG